MTALAEAPRFPEALDDDNDDVAWALQTAGVQWNRGGRADAIVWLRRAVDTAVDLGLHERAQELNRMTEALDAFVQAGGEFGPVGTGPASSGTASSSDVDALLDGRSALPSVELGSYEIASQSLVDAVELEAGAEEISPDSTDSVPDLVGEIDIEQPVEDEADDEIEVLDDVELLDEDEIEAIDEDEDDAEAVPLVARTDSRPLPPARSPLPPPRSQLPPPRGPLPLPRVPPPPRPPPSAVKEEVPPPSEPLASLSSEPAASPPSEPAVQAYRETTERLDETTQRRSSPFAVETSAPSEPSLEAPLPSRPVASRPYFEEDELPTGVRELSPASLAELELGADSAEPESEAPEAEPESEAPEAEPESEALEAEAESEALEDEPLGGTADEVTIAEAEPAFPVLPALTARESSSGDHPPPGIAKRVEARRGRDPSLVDDELEIPEGGSVFPPPVIEREPEPTEPEPPPVAAFVAAEAPPPAFASTSVSGEPSIGGIVLAEVRGLEDLPPETQEELIAKARVEKLGPEEEISSFGLALVLKGNVAVMPAIADVVSARAGVGEPVFTAGNLTDGVEMRVVAQGDGAEVAVWQSEDFEGAMASCPWVADELREVADRFQALAGATMGPLGERLDDMMRAMVTERATVKRLEAGERLVEKGKPLPGLHIVGAGRLETEGGGEHLPGDLLFASQILGGGSTPATVNAGDQGALVLFIDRMTTHELMMSVPPLLELLATS